MNILVTGATGFVGKPLCDRLLLKKHDISATIRQSNDFQKLPKGITSITINSLNEPLPPESLKDTHAIIYLAARVHQLNDDHPNPLEAYREINTHAAVSLAKQAIEQGVKRFIYLSSIKVNGESTSNLTHPYTEDNQVTTVDPYGKSKWEAEQALLQLAQETGLEVVILRPPLIYGANVKANFLQLFKIVNRQIPLPFALVDNSRSLLYVGNLVDAIITCIDHPNAKNQIFVLSDGEDLSTPDLIRRIAKSLNKPANLLPIPPSLLKLVGQITGKSDAIARLLGSLQVDSSKIRQTLDWKPPYTVDEGLQATADWFKSR